MSNFFSQDKLYSRDEVMSKLGIGLTTLNRLSRESIPPIFVSKRIRRWSGSVLNKYISKQTKYRV